MKLSVVKFKEVVYFDGMNRSDVNKKVDVRAAKIDMEYDGKNGVVRLLSEKDSCVVPLSNVVYLKPEHV